MCLHCDYIVVYASLYYRPLEENAIDGRLTLQIANWNSAFLKKMKLRQKRRTVFLVSKGSSDKTKIKL